MYQATMRTVLSLKKTLGHSGYFEIWKKSDGEYVVMLMLSRSGIVFPITKSKKNLHLKTLFTTNMTIHNSIYWAEHKALTLQDFFNCPKMNERYCLIKSDQKLWKKIQKTIKEKI
tara:strand:- start:33 stop:377 length:345 start_codon:yes stop_codon:yes gene_type:complete